MQRNVTTCDFCGNEYRTRGYAFKEGERQEFCSIECLSAWSTHEAAKRLQLRLARVVEKGVEVWDVYCRQCEESVSCVRFDFVARTYSVEPCGHDWGVGFRERVGVSSDSAV